MRVLFDISHPAHVHFFKHMIRELEHRGHATAIIAREKDVTHELLRHYGFEFASTGRSGRRSRLRLLAELLRRDWAIWRLARRFKPDVILTRNPCGVQVARLVGAVGIFDTDDGRAAGIHSSLATPFAHVITTPDCLPDDYGRKHARYPGYKQTAYLHPNRFTPNPEVLGLLGVAPGEPYFVARFVAMAASHDRGQTGLDSSAKVEIVRRLAARGRVFLTTEGALPAEWEPYRAPIPAHRIHDALAFASLYIGDSQTMAAEAAVLGTPALRCSSFAGRLPHLEELEHRYGLLRSFHPRETARLLAALDERLAAGDARAALAPARARLLADKCDVTHWMCGAIELCAAGPRGIARRLAEAQAALAGRAT